MTRPATQARALRGAASLIENSSIPGLSITVDADPGEQITIQVPEYLGTQAERTAPVAKLAAAVGGTATREASQWNDGSAWVLGAGTADGHSFRIHTSIPDAEPQGATRPDDNL